MELDYYLFKNKIKNKDFAQEIGIGLSTLNNILTKRATPNLRNAWKITLATHREVDFSDLLSTTDNKEIRKFERKVIDNLKFEQLD